MKMKKGNMDGVLLRRAGQEGVILDVDRVESQFNRIGLNLGRYNIPGTKLVLLYHTGEVLQVGKQMFLVGDAMIFHRKHDTISELNEDEVFEALMELVEREVKVTADGESFMVCELS